MIQFDVDRARADTPGVANVVHFNNAGASLMPVPVSNAIIDHLRREVEVGGYEAAEEAAERLGGVYQSLAALINASPDEIAVVENATRAWDMAFYSIPLAPGDRILTARSEYASNFIAYLQVARRTGAIVEPIPNAPNGQVDVDALAAMIDRKVKLIAITHVPTNGGLVNPASDVGTVAREHGIPYLLDACQSVGQMPIDVETLGCDFLSATGRKYLRGPRGTGFLYARRSAMGMGEPPFLDLHAATWVGADRYETHDDARRYETWEGNVAGKIGLGTAADYAMGWGIESIRARVWPLADLLRERLAALPGVVVRDQGVDRCGIVSFSWNGGAAGRLKAYLHQHRVNVSVSPASYTRLDMDDRGLEELVRASVHYFNTEDEIDHVARLIGSLGG